MIIIKIGGGESLNIPGIAADCAKIREPILIVHGANALRDRLAAQLHIEKRTVTSVSGYSSVYSDDSAIDLLMLAYSGLKNKQVVQALLQAGVNAIGLSGLDGRLIQGRRNQGIRVRENGRTMMLRDRSGKPKSINKPLLDLLMSNGYVPVLTMPIVDEENVAINSENDDVVALLQNELSARLVIQLIEAPGLLAQADDPQSLVEKITASELADWESKVEGRIKRKLHALCRLFEKSSPQVMITDGRGPNPVCAAMEGKGTTIIS